MTVHLYRTTVWNTTGWMAISLRKSSRSARLHWCCAAGARPGGRRCAVPFSTGRPFRAMTTNPLTKDRHPSPCLTLFRASSTISLTPWLPIRIELFVISDSVYNVAYYSHLVASTPAYVNQSPFFPCYLSLKFHHIFLIC